MQAIRWGLALCVAAAGLVSAPAAASGGAYHWWGYEQPPVEKEPEKKKEAPKKRQPLGPPPPRARMMKMHPDDLSELREKYHKQAVWRPTRENVLAYKQVQDVIRRKAVAEAAVEQVVLLENPELNVAREYPVTNAGRNAQVRRRSRETKQLLAANRGEFALLHFVENGCAYCDVQRGVLDNFARSHGWEVTEVNVDRRPGAAARFGIEFQPTTLLIRRGTKDWMPVGVGVTSVPEIEDNTFRGIQYMRGEIQPEQFFLQGHDKKGVFDPVIEARSDQ